MLVTLLLLWLGTLFIFFLLRSKRPDNFPPGPTPIPVFGNLLLFDRNNPLKTLSELSKKYGSVFSVFIGGRPAVILTGQQVIREVLVTQSAEFSGRPRHMMISHLTGNNGILVADYGSSWREHRRFALTTLRNFGLGKESMEQRILAEVEHICTQLEAHAGKSMNPQHLFHHAASNIICSIIFGSRMNFKDDLIQGLIHAIEDLNKIAVSPWSMIYEILPVIRLLPLPFKKAFKDFADIRVHILQVVANHRKNRVIGEPRDLIDCYLDEMEKRADRGTSFNDAQMAVMLFDLFLAGTDTTSNTLRCLTLYLMTHPDIQEQCQQEIEKVLGSRENVSYEDRNSMPYVQAVIHEAQRISDVVPLSVFHTAQVDTKLQGFNIPKGTVIIPNLSSALKEEGQWKFPNEFNPQNFLNDDGEFVKPEAFMPFSAGSRICLGEGLARMELFLILCTILRRFRLVWPEDGGKPDYTMIFGGTQSVKPYNMGIQIRT